MSQQGPLSLPIFEQICLLLESNSSSDAIYKLLCLPMGAWDKSSVERVIEHIDLARIVDYFQIERDCLLRAYVEKYCGAVDSLEKNGILYAIEEIISNPYYGGPEEEIASDDIAFMRHSTLSERFIQFLFSIDDESVFKLFLKHLPRPRPSWYSQVEVPKLVSDLEKTINEHLNDFVSRNQVTDKATYDVLERKIIAIQQNYRHKKRIQQERNRITWMSGAMDDKSFHQLLEDANKIYRPKGCSSELADRIMSLSKEAHFLSKIMHRTHSKFLTSILDEGLFGRESLHGNLMPFVPAALSECDMYSGDSNSICFGAEHGEIDSLANGNIEITFELTKIGVVNRSAFFKQRDFGFSLAKKRRAKLGSMMLSLRHSEETEYEQCHESIDHSCLFLSFNNSQASDYQYWSELPDSALISNNVADINQILIMNFFKYLDRLQTLDGDDALNFISMIYSQIEKSNDNDVIEFLKSIGMALSDTMEFNFYGAHLIDFQSVVSIKKRINCALQLEVKISDLIEELNNGESKRLVEIATHFSELLSSYRFIDFLLSSTNHASSFSLLECYYHRCHRPAYLPKITSFFESKPRMTLISEGCFSDSKKEINFKI